MVVSLYQRKTKGFSTIPYGDSCCVDMDPVDIINVLKAFLTLVPPMRIFPWETHLSMEGHDV